MARTIRQTPEDGPIAQQTETIDHRLSRLESELNDINRSAIGIEDTLRSIRDIIKDIADSLAGRNS